MSAIIKAQDVSVRVGDSEILHTLSFEISHGARVALLGPSGSGKTSLLKTILGLMPYTSGQLSVAGERIEMLSARAKAAMLSYVPQVLERYPEMTVAEFLSIAQYEKLPRLFAKNGVRAAIRDTLRACDMLELENASLSVMSAGERQRVLFAAAYLQDTAIMLLDEPTSCLDFARADRIYDSLRERSVEGKTVLLASHNINHALLWADTILALRSGKLVFFGPREIFATRENLETVYGGSFTLEPHPTHNIPMVLPK